MIITVIIGHLPNHCSSTTTGIMFLHLIQTLSILTLSLFGYIQVCFLQLTLSQLLYIYSKGGKYLWDEILAFSHSEKFEKLKLLYTKKFEFWHNLKLKNSQVAKLNSRENLLL